MTNTQTAPLGLSRSGFLPDRTVHLHPLDRCNLACSHCYSSSSPARSTILPVDQMIAALPALRAQGYGVISLSGGEPLLYPGLARLSAAARALGFRVVAISNGFRVTPHHPSLVADLDRIAISFDGMQATHLAMRGHPRAWDAAIAALKQLKNIGTPAAAAFTVSTRSLGEVPEFVDMCAGLGVQSVQLRPLVLAGRAVQDAADAALSPADLARLWMMGQTLSLAYQGEVSVHTDLAPAQALAADRGAWDGALASAALAGVAGAGLLSDVVNPLVITPQGLLRPFTYDFPSLFDLGHLSDLTPRRLPALQAHLPRIANLLRKTLDAVATEDGFIDWFAYQRDQAVLELA